MRYYIVVVSIDIDRYCILANITDIGFFFSKTDILKKKKNVNNT